VFLLSKSVVQFLISFLSPVFGLNTFLTGKVELSHKNKGRPILHTPRPILHTVCVLLVGLRKKFELFLWILDYSISADLFTYDSHWQGASDGPT
jgi:hypothetical protein